MRTIWISAALAAIGAIALAGCGSDGGGGYGNRGDSPPPEIESVAVEGEDVTVAYRIPGADPVQMLLSVDDADDEISPLTETVYPIEQEGEVTMGFEYKPNFNTILASVTYEDGSRSDVIRYPLDP